MSNKTNFSIDDGVRIFADPALLTPILQAGIYSALLKHKQAGNPVCEWRDNKVVWIAPEDICIKSFRKNNEK